MGKWPFFLQRANVEFNVDLKFQLPILEQFDLACFQWVWGDWNMPEHVAVYC